MRLFYRTRYSTMRASLLTRQKGFPVFPPPNPFAIATSEWEFCVAGLFTHYEVRSSHRQSRSVPPSPYSYAPISMVPTGYRLCPQAG